MADITKSSPSLQFNPTLPKKELEKVRDNVSAIVVNDRYLWLGGDEGTFIHRMTRDPSGNFGDHASFDLKEALKLPGSDKEEIDIEGLDVDGGYLWLIGSHSAKRRRPKLTNPQKKTWNVSPKSRWKETASLSRESHCTMRRDRQMSTVA